MEIFRIHCLPLIHPATADTSALGPLSPASLTAVIWIFTVAPLGRPVSVASVSLTVATLRDAPIQRQNRSGVKLFHSNANAD
jgi:hypothetical protein